MLSAAVSASPSIQAGMASSSSANSASSAPATNAAVTVTKSKVGKAPPAGASPNASPGGPSAAAACNVANGALRFEDLTIDDALPPLPRLQRYARSGIALQRLVHVKMLGEVAGSVG